MRQWVGDRVSRLCRRGASSAWSSPPLARPPRGGVNPLAPSLHRLVRLQEGGGSPRTWPRAPFCAAPRPSAMQRGRGPLLSENFRVRGASSSAPPLGDLHLRGGGVGLISDGDALRTMPQHTDDWQRTPVEDQLALREVLRVSAVAHAHLQLASFATYESLK